MKINKIFLGMALLLAVGFTSCEDDNLQSNQTKINEPTWAKDLYPGAEWSLASPSKYGYSADLGEKIDTLVMCRDCALSLVERWYISMVRMNSVIWHLPVRAFCRCSMEYM